MRSNMGGSRGGAAPRKPPVFVGSALVLLLLVSLLATGRWGSSVWSDGNGDPRDGSDVPSSRSRGATKRLVSQRTPEWDRLYAEGLYHPNSGYPRAVPLQKDVAEEALRWDERVQKEWPNGCKPLPNGKKRCFPKLIIMGQFKCGTTALFDTLAQHPDLLLPHTKTDWETKCPRNKPRCVIKEVNGFIRGYGGRFTEEQLLSRYDPLSPDIDADDERMMLEASPYYLTGSPDSFEDLTRFPRFVPGVKMIAIVRNPVERAFSEYVMFSERPFRKNAWGCAWGHNYTFEDLALEELAVRSPALLHDSSKKNGCLLESTKFQHVESLPNGTSRFAGRLLGWGEYARFLELWMRTLPPEQLMVVKTEDLEGNSGPQLVSEILDWAGLQQVPLKVRRSNTASCRGSHARGAFDEERAKAIESGACDEPTEKSPQKAFDPAVAATLHAHFRSHNAHFKRLTGMDTSNWDTSKHLKTAAG